VIEVVQENLAENVRTGAPLLVMDITRSLPINSRRMSRAMQFAMKFDERNAAQPQSPESESRLAAVDLSCIAADVGEALDLVEMTMRGMVGNPIERLRELLIRALAGLKVTQHVRLP
jgi:hypothetical protein